MEGRNLTNEERLQLEQEVEKVFVHQLHMQEMANRVAMLNPANIPKIFEDTLLYGEGFDIGMSSMEGTFTSPYFGEEVSTDTFKQDLKAHYKISFPSQDLKRFLNSKDVLFMKLSSTSSDHHRVEDKVEWLGARIKLYKDDPKSWKQARAVCLAEGGDLASYSSFKEWELHYPALKKIFNNEGRVWLGGTDADEELNWVWSDGSPWWDMFYKGFGKDQGDDGDLENCLAADMGRSAMIDYPNNVPYPPEERAFRNAYDDSCLLKYPFLCSVPPTHLKSNQNISRTWTAEDLPFDSIDIWWSHTVSGWSLREKEKRRMPGFLLEWGLEKAVEETANKEDTGMA